MPFVYDGDPSTAQHRWSARTREAAPALLQESIYTFDDASRDMYGMSLSNTGFPLEGT